MIVDSAAAIQFLRTAFEPEDWIALFLKSYETGRTAQRVGPVATFLELRVHAWLRAMNAHRFNVYVSVNAIRPGVRARTKSAIGAIRHLFLEADHDGSSVLAQLNSRADIPAPSYVLESSPNRVHMFWRVVGFTNETIEPLQKQLAEELRTDVAATACSQTTRLPGYLNHKHRLSPFVTIEYGMGNARYTPRDFPICRPPVPTGRPPRRKIPAMSSSVVERARRYLGRVAPAVAGEHGDLHTFCVCCRIVRGFDLSIDEALRALVEWNLRCQPPWSERELRDKIIGARKYGREAIGGMLA